jgi:hypothetical protein
LSKGREDTIASRPVAVRAAFDECTEVPESLVRSIHVQELFIFAELELYPGRFRVPVTVPFCEHSCSLLSLVVDVEPSAKISHISRRQRTGEIITNLGLSGMKATKAKMMAGKTNYNR